MTIINVFSEEYEYRPDTGGTYTFLPEQFNPLMKIKLPGRVLRQIKYWDSNRCTLVFYKEADTLGLTFSNHPICKVVESML